MKTAKNDENDNEWRSDFFNNKVVTFPFQHDAGVSNTQTKYVRTELEKFC